MLGILSIDKPQGISSHDVVYKVRKALGTKKVGHAGTLDPLATGVLVVAVGAATRFLQYLPTEPKEYEFEATFGEARNTQDLEGEVTFTGPVPADLRAQVEAVMPQFTGEIQQLPPMFSAIKKDGKPLYLLARQGVEVERESRTVTIHSLEIIDVYDHKIHFKCVCSGGTYIRTLAHDIGEAIGSGAYVSALARTAVGEFDIAESIKIEDISTDHLIPLEDALTNLPIAKLDPQQTATVRNGGKVTVRPVPEGKHALLMAADGPVALAEIDAYGFLQPLLVIPKE